MTQNACLKVASQVFCFKKCTHLETFSSFMQTDFLQTMPERSHLILPVRYGEENVQETWRQLLVQYPQHIVINPSMLRASQQKFLFGSAGQRGDEETFVPAPALDPLFCCKSFWLQSTSEHSQAPDSRNSRHSCETLSETSWDLRDERLVMSPLNHQRSNVFLLFLSLLTLLCEGEASLGDNKLICLFTFWSCTCDGTYLSLFLSLVRSLSPSLSPLSSSLPLRSHSVRVSPLPSVLIGVHTHV